MGNQLRNTTLAAFLAVAPGAAFAVSCDDAMTTVDMIACADADLKAADKALNEAYRERRRSLDETGANLLRDAQRAWIKFRDAECLVARDEARGGTMAPLLEIGCLTNLTEKRTVELRSSGFLEMSTGEIIPIPGQSVEAEFSCTGSERAEIGLVPAIDAEGTPALYARVTVGNHEIDIPIGTGGDVGLCGTNLTLDRSEAGTPCPALRVDDGMCDAVHVYWDEASGRYLATRLN